MSRQATLIREFLLRNNIRARGHTLTLLQRRAQDDLAMKTFVRPPKGTETEHTEVAGMPALWVWAEGVDPCSPKTLLYFHGGGFFSGSAETHRGLAAAISGAAGVRALLVDYRLSPEHLYPAAHEDALAAYRWLLGQGVKPRDIALGGDSAGGNLALSTLLAARGEGLPLPAAAVLLSPWLDVLDSAGESYTTRVELDPSIDAESTLRDARGYFGPEPRRPEIDLLKRDLTGLPPLLIQVGDREVLLSDSQTLHERALAFGVDSTLEIWLEMWHVFQALTVILPEAREAIENIGNFISERLAE